jgi:hypothetical protein
MNYKFFAYQQDFEEISRYLLEELRLSIFQSYSDPEQPLKEFRSVEELINEINTQGYPLQLVLWKKAFGFDYKINRIELNPKYCNGKTFRYRIDGWGLILLQVNGPKGNSLEASSISHNSEKRATAWESTNTGLGKVKEVSWKEINSTSSKLKYYIGNKLAKTRTNSLDTLPNAKEYLESIIV